MQYGEEYILKNKPNWVIELFRKIDDFCLKDIQPGVKRTYLQTYVRYTHRDKMFCKILVKQERLKIYLRLVYAELTQKPRFIRDYSDVAKQTWVELTITENDLLKNEVIILDLTRELIKQSFERVLKNPRLSKFPTFGKKVITPEFVSTTTRGKISLEIGTDGFVDLKLRCHKSELTSILNKILE